MVSSAIVLVVTVLIPFSWIAEPLGIGPPTATTLLALLAITVGYVLATEVAKHRLPRLLGAFG